MRVWCPPTGTQRTDGLVGPLYLDVPKASRCPLRKTVLAHHERATMAVAEKVSLCWERGSSMDPPEFLKEPAPVEASCPNCGHAITDNAASCPSCGGKLRELLVLARMQGELGKIDRDWEQERQKFMVSVEGEEPWIPTGKRSSVISSLAFVVLGLIGVAYYGTQESGTSGEIVFFVILVIVGVLVGLWEHGKIDEYEYAEAAYRKRRKEAEERFCGKAEAKD